MMLKILIRTPKGRAKTTEYQIRPFILGRQKTHQVLTNQDDNKILWIIDASPKDYIRIIKNVSAYSVLIRKILSFKALRRAAKLSKTDEEQLDDMLTNQTEISVIKHDQEDLIKEFKQS